MSGPLWRLARAAWGREGSGPAPALAAVLGPFSWAFGALVGLRGRFYDRVGGTRVPGIAVLSVGNLAVGGTGKTPVAAWAARALSTRGARPAVVLRGYGGDEIALHRTWNPELLVIAAPERVRGVRAARDAGADVAVLDDGFQHRRVARHVDLVLLAVEDPLPPRLLPAGPYREPLSALAKADAVVLTRRTASMDDARRVGEVVERSSPGLVVACARLGISCWQDVHGARTSPPPGPTLVVAAVARPEVFRAEVERVTGSSAELLAFRDHHEFTPQDVRTMARRAAGRPVVVTEKDAVKLRGIAPPLHVAVEALAWDWGEDRLIALIDGLMGDPPGRARTAHRAS